LFFSAEGKKSTADGFVYTVSVRTIFFMKFYCCREVEWSCLKYRDNAETWWFTQNCNSIH